MRLCLIFVAATAWAQQNISSPAVVLDPPSGPATLTSGILYVQANAAATAGGGMDLVPILYSPTPGQTCYDAFGNLVSQPVGTFGTNDIIMWNSTSPLQGYHAPFTLIGGQPEFISGTACAPPLPLTSGAPYGINVNSYVFARQGFATDGAEFNMIQVFNGGIVTQSLTAAGLYPRGQSTACCGTLAALGTYLGGYVQIGHSVGPPQAGTIATVTNPLTVGDGVEQGTLYWEDGSGLTTACPSVSDNYGFSCLAQANKSFALTGVLTSGGSPAWNSGTAYVPGDEVSVCSSTCELYESILAGTNQAPASSPTFWADLGFAGGINVLTQIAYNSVQSVGGFSSSLSSGSTTDAFSTQSGTFQVNGQGTLSAAGVISSTGASGGLNVTTQTAFNSIQTVGGMYAALGYTSDQADYLKAYASSGSLNTPGAGYGALAYQNGSIYYYYNKTSATWGTFDFSAAGVCGADKDVIFNSSGACGATANLQYITGSNTLAITGASSGLTVGDSSHAGAAQVFGANSTATAFQIVQTGSGPDVIVMDGKGDISAIGQISGGSSTFAGVAGVFANDSAGSSTATFTQNSTGPSALFNTVGSQNTVLFQNSGTNRGSIRTDGAGNMVFSANGGDNYYGLDNSTGNHFFYLSAIGGIPLEATINSSGFSTIGAVQSTITGASIAFQTQNTDFQVDGQGDVSGTGQGSFGTSSYTGVAGVFTNDSTTNPTMTVTQHNGGPALVTNGGENLFGLSSSDVSPSTGAIISSSDFISVTASTNASVGSFAAIAGTYVALGSGHSGSGTDLPLAFFTSSNERERITVGGVFLYGLTSTDVSVSAGAQVTSQDFVSVTASTNASVGSFKAVASNYVAVSSGVSGAGTMLPLAFFTNNAKNMELETSGNLTLNKLIGTYNNVATTGMGVAPIYVAGSASVGSDQQIALTPGGSSAPAGQYKACLYSLVASVGGGVSIANRALWTDGTNSWVINFPTTGGWAQTVTTSSSNVGCLFIHTNGSNPSGGSSAISLSIAGVGASSGYSETIWYSLERIQ